jgi:hypothetical protein
MEGCFVSTEILQQTLSQFQQVQKPAPKTVACSLSLAEIKKQFLKKVDELAYTRHRWQVWQDWTESAALSIANSI